MQKTTLLQTLKMMKEKKISSVELTKEYLQNIKNSDLNAFVTVCEDIAIAQAKKSDENIQKGEMKKLEGIPMGIKDVFCTDGVRTTAGSKMLENFVPNYNADVVQKILDENMVNLGKLNMDEFAMGSTTENSYFGATYNPIKSKTHPDWKLTPGGSSGGSSAAVAGNLSIAAIGSDTGGSVRQPASFCGLVGAKPTYGTCSRYGIVSYASSFDTPGFLGKDVSDVAYLMEIISGHSPRDAMMYKNFKADFLTNINNSIKGMKIGIPVQFSKNIPDYIAEKLELAKKMLEKLGASVDFVDIKHIEKSINVYYIITPAEMCSNLGKYSGIIYGSRASEGYSNIEEYYIKTRSENFGNEVKKRIMIGNYVLASGNYAEHYEKAMKVRRLIKNEFDKVFENHDAILCPTTFNVAFDTVNQPQDPITTYMNDISTAPANIAGLPAISIPFGENEDGLPIGMQIMTNRCQDAKMYQIAKNLENELGK